jgi:hypothetical protein
MTQGAQNGGAGPPNGGQGTPMEAKGYQWRSHVTNLAATGRAVAPQMSSHFLFFTNIRQSMWHYANGMCLKLLWWPPKPWNHHFHTMFATISTTQNTFPKQRKCIDE